MDSHSTAISKQLVLLLQNLNFEDCTEIVPAPVLLEEPRFTRGNSNIICFRLPPVGSLPVSPDSIKDAVIITKVRNHSTGALLEFPLPVNISEDSTKCDTIRALTNSTRYSYSSALFLLKCLTDCDSVVDNSDIELLCSPYADTVWSIQDQEPPVVQSPEIPQLESNPAQSWWNRSKFTVEAKLLDPAGIEQGFLYRRSCNSSGWQAPVHDSTFTGEMSPQGYIFAEQQSISFKQNLTDGCYEFRIESKDASHTPASYAGHFELAGNASVPASGDEAMIRINIDTTPPDTVELSCAQSLNSIILQWSVSTDRQNGIGLASYYIRRNGVVIDTAIASQITYQDRFTVETPEQNIVYQIQPFDSLGNVQRDGGFAICIFRPVFKIEMIPEPEYTSGHSNQVSWTGIPNTKNYSLFKAMNDDFASADSVLVPDTTYNVRNLVDGAVYAYWVVAEDSHNRIVYSDTVKSIQDATLPDISFFDIPERIIINGKNWINHRNIDLEIRAHDNTPGKLRHIEISENDNIQFVLSILPATVQLDTSIAYPVQLQKCKQINLGIRVVDVAGNISEVAKIEIRLDDKEPDAVPSLTCAQLNDANGIRLTWERSLEEPGCSGLAGYRILRDHNLIDIVATNVLTYENIFAKNMQSAVFTYQIQPFDSVGNVQTTGGISDCDYVGTSAISIKSMKKFTAGLENTVCWEVTGSLISQTLFLDTGCDNITDDSVQYAESTPSATCHTFNNLNNGQKYCFWVTGEDAQQRLVVSDTVSSTQDNSLPSIELFSCPGAEKLNEQLWVYSPQIKLRLVAQDNTGGEIWDFIISENDMPGEVQTFNDSLQHIDKTILYTIQTLGPHTQQVELTTVVLDGAGNSSQPDTLKLLLQEKLSRIFAFPNPFNPEAGDVTIRVADINENEINIYDFFGNLVRRLDIKANDHDFTWNGRNGAGDHVANGGYICIGSKTRARFKIAVTKRR